MTLISIEGLEKCHKIGDVCFCVSMLQEAWRKLIADFFKKKRGGKGNQSSIQNASTDASLFLEGFLEEATEAERHDGDAIASPLVKMLKSSLCLILWVALEMKVTLTPKPTCVRALPLFLFKDGQIYPGNCFGIPN